MHALLVLGLLATVDKTKDAANIQGTWVVVSAVNNGKPDDEIKDDKLTFKDGMLTIKAKKKDERGTYKIDPSQKPGAIDIAPEGEDKTRRGIYKLEGDKLTICLSPELDGKRPTEFTSEKDSYRMLVELKREKK